MKEAITNNILIIDDEPEIGWIFSKILSGDGYQVQTARSGEEGLTKFKKICPELVFLDMKLPGLDGLETLKKIKEFDRDTAVIMITGFETVKTAVESMKLGAYDYITKPLPAERLKIIVDHVFNNQKLAKKVTMLQQQLGEGFSLNKIVGNSPQWQEVLTVIEKVSRYDVMILIRGESGTGKDLIAQAVHFLSNRKKEPFVPIDCAVLPESLVESELFGYERGAFTGADAMKIGRIEAANGGTVFLDEIGNMPLAVQKKLLRVLQEKKIERLGGKKSIALDVRIIAATNLDLAEAMKKDFFRADLYHRLNEFSVSLPPLRERSEDVLVLTHYFINEFNAEFGKRVKGVSSEVREKFLRYNWPGNVRELKNMVRRIMLMVADNVETIEVKDLNPEIGDLLSLNAHKTLGNSKMLREIKAQATEEAERDLICQVLEENYWNKRKSAIALGIDYKTLYNKMKLYKIGKGD